MNGKLNGGFWQKVAAGAFLLLLSITWVWVDTRASEDDVDANTVEIAAVKEDINDLKLNVALTCQFLSRQDKLAGGPGLDCKVPE